MKKPKTKTKGFNAQQYMQSLHLGDLFEAFAFETNKNGTLKYQTVHQFVKKHTKTDKQYEVLYWITGPKVEVGNNQIAAFPDIPQFDWMTRRENGHWHSSKNTQSLRKQIEQHASSMDQLSATGTVNISMLAMLEQLQAQLVKEFGTQLFLPNADPEENKARAELFLSLTERIAQLQGSVQTQYAKVKGIDISNLSAFLSLFGTAMQPTMIGNNRMAQLPGVSEKSNLMDQFKEMVLAKSVKYNLDPPEDIRDNIISEGEVLSPKKKAKVQ